jgi:hypothetical protein
MRNCFIVFLCMALLFVGCMAPEEPPEENVTVEPPVVPPPVTCSDSDQGVDPTVKGTVTIGNESYEDSCKDNATVLEYYCDNNALGQSEAVCPDGFMCGDGACVEVPEEPPPPECQETDSGKDYEVPGSVTYKGSTHADTCQGNYDLIEYYCEDDAMKQETHHCGTGNRCENGACTVLEKTCTDSDANDESARGTVMQYGGGMVIGQWADSCVDNATKLEFFCENGGVGNKTEACTGETYCTNGVCAPLCQDADGGKDYDEASYVMSYAGRFEDYCSSNYTLVEYYCLTGIAFSDTERCDEYCYEGRCLSESDTKCKEYNGGSTVQILYDNEVLKEYNDTCLDQRVYRDYLCVQGEVEKINFACDRDELCYKGECLLITEEACYDLDEDEEDDGIFVASMVILTDNESIDQTKEDSCIGSTIVLEYKCDGRHSMGESINCPEEYKCIDGACAYPYTCTETDGGKNIEPGEASLWEDGDLVRTEKDGCSGDGNIWEIYCSDDRLTYTTIPCPEGTTCDSETRRCG